MRIRQLTICVFVLLTSAVAFAQSENYFIKPIVFDPSSTGTVVSQWVKHLGNGEGEGDNENWGLLLSKNTATATNSAAFAQVLLICCAGNLNIRPLSELGFDIRNGGHCGAGSPRFNVITADKANHFVGGCANGTISTSPNPGWQRVRFDPANPNQAFPPVQPSDVVVKIFIVADEGVDTGTDFSGLSILDDIDVNGDLIGEPKS
jgi:hypothetical protein